MSIFELADLQEIELEVRKRVDKYLRDLGKIPLTQRLLNEMQTVFMDIVRAVKCEQEYIGKIPVYLKVAPVPLDDRWNNWYVKYWWCNYD